MLPFFLKLFTNSKPPPDDRELLRLYRQTGELEHLGELFQRHSELVYLVCLKYLKDEEESKDATMQLFGHIADALLKHEVDNFKSWLHSTTRNFCLMQLRASKKNKSIALENSGTLFMENTPPMHLTEAEQVEETEQALQQALQELPPEQRQCIELFYLQQKSYREISALTGCDLNKVKSYIQNGKRNLKLYLEKNHVPR
ncbi:RNA polymerase sigma-70 factor (ECF subfamily) [Pontibacter aydingkolensis]|uniref:Sigma-70 family RNA polymerase sigma factor n=1 Tax=Pontibacter aydingkolensis TaxID=1911536 RepID=A0ABS7CXV3_9BACT|nr:sigma-70 family RNA polymerase sigma factor [Pontibacter aydingkolensis]MBW7468671.1 sigma-70 family RNA polymerase sigma factor [Pontibacter aydingkolensis]